MPTRIDNEVSSQTEGRALSKARPTSTARMANSARSFCLSFVLASWRQGFAGQPADSQYASPIISTLCRSHVDIISSKLEYIEFKTWQSLRGEMLVENLVK